MCVTDEQLNPFFAFYKNQLTHLGMSRWRLCYLRVYNCRQQQVSSAQTPTFVPTDFSVTWLREKKNKDIHSLLSCHTFPWENHTLYQHVFIHSLLWNRKLLGLPSQGLIRQPLMSNLGCTKPAVSTTSLGQAMDIVFQQWTADLPVRSWCLQQLEPGTPILPPPLCAMLCASHLALCKLLCSEVLSWKHWLNELLVSVPLKSLPVLLDWNRCYLSSSRSLWITGDTFQIGGLAKPAASMNSYSIVTLPSERGSGSQVSTLFDLAW